MSFCLIISVFTVINAANVTKSPENIIKTTSGLGKAVAVIKPGTYSADSIIVQKILDTNGRYDQVSDVSDSAKGRIIHLIFNGSSISILPSQIGNLSALNDLDLS
jgi:hypothetical protein